jgi:hypothetical protein
MTQPTKQTKTQRAAHYLASWLETKGRFDLYDLAERTGVYDELESIVKIYAVLIRDDADALELEPQEETEAPNDYRPEDYLSELTTRYFQTPN